MVYIVGFIFTVELDYSSDAAEGLYYAAAEGGPRVFYEKVIVHIVGIIVFVSTAVSSGCSLVFESDADTFLYAISMISILLSGIYNLVKLYKSQKIIAFVLTIDGQDIRFIVKRSRIYPPHGRIIHYELDLAYLPFLLN